MFTLIWVHSVCGVDSVYDIYDIYTVYMVYIALAMDKQDTEE